MLKKRAVTAFACRVHREAFDKRKQEAEERRQAERARRKKAKAA